MSLSIGLLGGMPPVLGGGGLEIQIDNTRRELEQLGHRVTHVELAQADTAFDLVHAFGSEPDNWHRVKNWYRQRVPLVVTPVISIGTRAERVALRAGSRLPGVVSSARMRRELLQASHAIVALTEYERGLVVGELGIDAGKVHVLGSGVTVPEPTAAELALSRTAEEPFVLLVGRVNAWKRQGDVIEAVGGRHRIVVAGALEDEGSEPAWEELVAAHRAIWLGQVTRGVLADLYERAAALVHVSVGEVQSLAVMEALSAGTRVVASDIPAHQELARRYGRGWIRLVDAPERVAPALEQLAGTPPPGVAPSIPTAREATAELVELYERVLA